MCIARVSVDSIMQVTFEDYTKNNIDEDIKVLSSEQKVFDILNIRPQNDINVKSGSSTKYSIVRKYK